MPANANATANITGFSVGQDLRTLILIPNAGGAPISSDALGRLLDFTANPVIQELQMVPVDLGGIRLVRNVYHGWDLEMTFGRYQGNMTYLMAAIMGNFNINGVETYFTVQAQILNTAQPALTVDTYTFTNAVFSSPEGVGRFGETARVEQRLMGRAQQILVNGVIPTQPSALPYGNGNQ